MSIMAYVGIPGSGKSYEVVSNVILGHFKKGRRIVTNIDGITHQKLLDWLSKYEPKFDLSVVGQLIHVSDEDCQDDNFFPFKGSYNTLCQPGDLICLDEIWRIFPTDKIKENHRSFVAEHRHFTHPDSGICCDLVVINQSVAGIPRFIKDRIETTFQMSRLVALGLSMRYRVNVYSGAKTTKNMLVTQIINKYDKRIFELYKSFDGVNGQTKSIDNRQNYFKSPQFKLSVFLILVFFTFSYYILSPYLFKDNSSKELTNKNKNDSSTKSNIDKKSNKDDKVEDNLLINKLQIDKKNFEESQKIISSNWRIVGELIKNNDIYVVLSDLNGNLRLEPRYFFEGKGRSLVGVVGGETVSYYSGVGKNEKFIYTNSK